MSHQNRLADEASPYLLQHARNPVDWWPWSDAALAEAKRRDVPILLSIGYSACHWCHVMERESFENEAIAKLMNERFVSVKVDREERPDLDQIYQLAVQLMGRSGGWPLTVFLTPAQKPFLAGTYFPPEDRHGMPGFPKLLVAVSEAYRSQREEIDGQADELTEAIVSVTGEERSAGGAVDASTLEHASEVLLQRVDDVYGGFGGAPKFPNTMPLEVLLRRAVLDDDANARSAAKLHLDSMRKGGIWDHLGGGFHRYATDATWLVPHFEKMLYDNALLLRSYVDAFRVFGDAVFADTARAIAGWVEREMTDADGGYYASQDADSEGEEGKFFVWDEADVKAAIGDDDEAARAAIAHFGITPSGNFEDHGRPTFKTVLHEARPPAPAAIRAASRMFAARESRPKPFRDEKILTSSGALMISALAEAGAALDDEALVASAERALAFVARALVTESSGGRLRVARLCKRVGARIVVKSPGFLDDHAYLANAALDVWEVTGDPAKVRLARAVADTMLALFWTEAGGFFFTPKDGETLITRAKDPYDNAVPSGASMAARALLRLGTLVDPRYAAIAEAELGRLAPAAIANAFAYGQTLCEIDRLVRGSVDVVVVGPRSDARTKRLARAAFRVWLPNRTLAWLDPDDASSREACARLAEAKVVGPGGEPVAYVCRGRTCSLPVTRPDDLVGLLQS